MLDTYEEPDCAMEAAMVKVILNATDMHDIFFPASRFAYFAIVIVF